ncbi:hypothetical protein FA13DRAFT_1524646 [Coprinellus micaceus]|uniref:Uncharacterized protein n=1 Tax=Coprinellus micaceus TaxID=71717 RepID=A0A4Y7SL93_COPMI|nr:hypothetical protein FA13DRAFT_1524646 [Coprinellus micaceus]
MSFEEEGRRGRRYGCSRNQLAFLSIGLYPVSYSSAWMRTLSGGIQGDGFVDVEGRVETVGGWRCRRMDWYISVCGREERSGGKEG